MWKYFEVSIQASIFLYIISLINVNFNDSNNS